MQRTQLTCIMFYVTWFILAFLDYLKVIFIATGVLTLCSYFTANNILYNLLVVRQKIFNFTCIHFCIMLNHYIGAYMLQFCTWPIVVMLHLILLNPEIKREQSYTKSCLN